MPTWDEAILQPGAPQMVHLKKLILSRPYLNRIPDQSLLPDVQPTLPADNKVHYEPARAAYPCATRADDGSFAMVYFPQAEPDSIYYFYKRLIELRKKQPVFCEGEYVWVDKNSNDYLAFLRRGKDDVFLVALNFSEQALDIPLNFEEYGIKSNGVKIILSSRSRSLIEENYPKLSLQPVETLIGKLT
jgi:hypothetical protein